MLRGYDAEWIIEKDKLFLTGITGSAHVTGIVKCRSEKLMLRILLKKSDIVPAVNGKMLREIRKEPTI